MMTLSNKVSQSLTLLKLRLVTFYFYCHLKVEFMMTGYRTLLQSKLAWLDYNKLNTPCVFICVDFCFCIIVRETRHETEAAALLSAKLNVVF